MNFKSQYEKLLKVLVRASTEVRDIFTELDGYEIKKYDCERVAVYIEKGAPYTGREAITYPTTTMYYFLEASITLVGHILQNHGELYSEPKIDKKEEIKALTKEIKIKTQKLADLKKEAGE